MKRVVLIVACSFVILVGCSSNGKNVKQNMARAPLAELLQALQDEDLTTRTLAAKRLSEYHVPESAEALRRASQSDSNDRVRLIAAKSLQRIPGYHLDTLNIASTLSLGDIQIEIDIQPSDSFNDGHRIVQTVHLKGILPIRIKINNRSNAAIKLEPDMIALLTHTGKQVPRLDNAELRERLGYSYKNAIRSTVIFPPMAYKFATTANTNQAVRERIASSQIGANTVANGAESEAYAFFDVPKTTGTVKDWKFTLGFDYNGKKVVIEDVFYKDMVINPL